MMRASQQAPQPQPLPPPPLSLPSPPAAPRRGRHRSSCSYSYSSSSSSSVSSSASTTFCPSPSPAASPFAGAAATSLVPFSWERHPGVPKNAPRGRLVSPTGTPLPLPPPLRPGPRRRRRRRRATTVVTAASSSDAEAKDEDDPFVAAIAECTRDDDYARDQEDDDAGDKLWPVPTKPTAPRGRWERRRWISAAGLVAFLDLYGCKSAMDVVAANSVPPAVRATPR